MNRSDWEAVRDALIAGDRAELGEPPTADELLAYERGELSAADAERVRRLLVAYPELATAFATEFPSEGDLPAGVVERQWNAFRGASPRAGALLFWRSAAAIAAAVAITFGALWWQAQHALAPRVLPEATILTPDGRRSASDVPQASVTPTGDAILLVVAIVGPIDYDAYRIDLVDAGTHRRIWSSETLARTDSNSFNVEVPTRLLSPGTCQVILYGVRGTAQEQVATYTIEVRARR